MCKYLLRLRCRIDTYAKQVLAAIQVIVLKLAFQAHWGIWVRFNLEVLLPSEFLADKRNVVVTERAGFRPTIDDREFMLALGLRGVHNRQVKGVLVTSTKLQCANAMTHPILIRKENVTNAGSKSQLS